MTAPKEQHRMRTELAQLLTTAFTIAQQRRSFGDDEHVDRICIFRRPVFYQPRAAEIKRLKSPKELYFQMRCNMETDRWWLFGAGDTETDAA